MRIAVNTRFLIPGQLEGYGYFVQQIFMRLAAMQPQHQFFFLFDRAYDTTLVFPANVTPVVIPPKARHALSFKWWFDVKVAWTLRQIKADCFVSPDGFCSLTTNKPQVVVIHDLAFLHYPKFIARHHLLFYKRYTPKFVRKARIVATVSEFSKQDIIAHYKTDPNKIINVSSAAKDLFMPVDWETKEIIKYAHTDGCEYFLFVGGIHPRKNLLNLLKAFSIFKKWQKSNMKLVVAGRLAWHYESVIEKLSTYKYREDVVLAGYLPEDVLARLVAAAYCLVFPSFFEGFGVPLIEAMQCDVPVITANNSSLIEIGGDAALYADGANPQDIAAQMKLVYKDENLRNTLIEKGRVQAAKYNWDKSTTLMWQAIEQAVSK